MNPHACAIIGRPWSDDDETGYWEDGRAVEGDGRGCGGAGEEERRCEGGVGLARLKLLLIMKKF